MQALDSGQKVEQKCGYPMRSKSAVPQHDLTLLQHLKVCNLRASSRILMRVRPLRTDEMRRNWCEKTRSISL